MTSIVLQLQELASTTTTSVAEIVRKARMVAIKLDLQEFNDWLTHELHGYPDAKSVPDYRRLHGDLRAHNPYNGALMPIRFDPQVTEMLSEVCETQSIGNLQELADSRSDHLQAPFGPRELAFVQKLVDPEYRDWLLPFRRISRTQLTAIIDRVRNLVLDWSLELEKKGVLGEGMTFSEDEKKRASSPSISINGNFQGIIGNVADSKVSQDFVMTIESGNFDSLARHLDSLSLPPAEIVTLQTAIDADPKPQKRGAFGPKVAAWFGNVVGKIAGGTYEIAVGAGGDLLANAIWQYYGFK